MRFFRGTRHVHTHTARGWAAWGALCAIASAVAFVLAGAVPIFAYLTSITSTLFASWYTYGVAGFFWLFDAYYPQGGDEGEGQSGGLTAWRRRWAGAALAMATVCAGAFICVAGTYVSVKVSVVCRVLFQAADRVPSAHC